VAAAPLDASRAPQAVPDAAVELRGVDVTFGEGPRAVSALAGIDLRVEEGRFVSIVGPSGSGKSTLLRLVTGLRRPDGGRVEVLGTTPRQAAAGKKIGFVPQSPALLPWRTVLDNVRLPAQVNRAGDRDLRGPRPDPYRLLEQVGLGDVADRRPGELSGGMAQRVAIARALASAPSLLVMDEPFSALDELTREVLRDVLLGVWQAARPTVLWVTHSVAEAVYLSDSIVVLSARPGRVLAEIADPLPRPRTPELMRHRTWGEVEDEVRAVLRAGWRHGGG
jgi:NitT/TauT family transport system ATP-binding protein